jgi:hypothetical protein
MIQDNQRRDQAIRRRGLRVSTTATAVIQIASTVAATAVAGAGESNWSGFHNSIAAIALAGDENTQALHITASQFARCRS